MYVKHLNYGAADKEVSVDLGFQGLFGTKHLYPDRVYGSAPWLLPVGRKKTREALWGADGKTEQQ